MAPSCCCWTAIVMLFAGFVLSTSATQNMTRQQQEDYLVRFGYLGDDANPGEELRYHQDEKFAQAVRRFQEFAGLNVTGVVDGATVHMMRMPRCGVADVGIIAEHRWTKVNVTYRFTPGVGYTSDLPRETVRKVFQQAFEMWSQAFYLRFSETIGPADIEISFGTSDHGDLMPFDNAANTLAHAFPPGRGVGGDAHFNEHKTWTVDSETGTNLLQVAVHEIGHSLGVGHSRVQSAVMTPFYRGYRPNFSLHRDDIDSIRRLYNVVRGHGRSRNYAFFPPHLTRIGHY